MRKKYVFGLSTSSIIRSVGVSWRRGGKIKKRLLFVEREFLAKTNFGNSDFLKKHLLYLRPFPEQKFSDF